MKKTILSYAVGAIIAAGALSGCEDSSYNESRDPVEAAIQSEAIKLSVQQSNTEQKELKDFLRVAKQLDPTITDAYYSTDSNGDKFINVVKAEKSPDESQQGQSITTGNGGGMLQTVGMSMAGGFVGSALANSIIPNHPSPSYYESNSRYHYNESHNEERRRRSNAVAGYNNHMVSKSVNRVRTNPVKMKAISTRISTSKPAFRSSSSARSSSYSGGSRGFGG